MPKTIRSTVGRAGLRSAVEDVVIVQYLLNCVPKEQGGPLKELRLDGIAGAETLAAITRFQEAAHALVDGCVVPNGLTLTLLQRFDPLPSQALSFVVPRAQYNPKELTVDKSVPWRR